MLTSKSNLDKNRGVVSTAAYVGKWERDSREIGGEGKEIDRYGKRENRERKPMILGGPEIKWSGDFRCSKKF